jgi:hypothetical protein
MVSVPVVRAVVEMLALPPLRATLEASVVVPDLKVTVPVGVPIDEVTVAAIVTVRPVVWGLGDAVTVVVVVALTIWLSAVEVLPSQPVEPVKTAVIECVPEASEEVENVALPVVVVTVTPEASVVVPSMKATVPEGIPIVEVTVAVKVTDCDGLDGFSEDATDVDVLTCTTWVNVPLLLVKPPVPVKAAVIEWLPSASVDDV